MEQRVLFSEGEQRKFLNLVKDRLSSPSIKGMLQFGLNVPYSTLKSYYKEEFSLPKNLFDDFCHLVKIDKDRLDVAILESNWGQIKGGKKGIRILQEKYPEEIKKWRMLGLKNSPVFKGDFSISKKIKIPELDEKLAEFIGAYLGDGTLNKYQLKIAGDYRYDNLYYNYLSRLVQELFGISASVQRIKNNNTSLLIIYSKNVCSFLNKNFNIKYGHKIKNKTIIPEQILEDKKLSIACLRGLMDTDGSVSRRGRKGSQFCIQFTSHNKFLLKQVYDLGKKIGIFTFYDKTGAGTNKWENIKKYFQIVGSSNPKHIVRFHLRTQGKTIYRYEVPNYFKQDLYRNLDLPFKLEGPVV